MNTFSLVFRSITQRALSVTLTGLSIALGVALISATLELKRQVEESFNQSSVGYEMILGAKGSALQLVLNTVYQLGDPVGNIPYSVYQKYRNHPMVSWAIPFGLGDNYKGYRIIGTTEEIFTKFTYKPNQTFELAEGRAFKDSEPFAAVLGSDVARQLQLKIGDKFIATHGLQDVAAEMAIKHEHDPMTVVGILKPTYTTCDKAIYISLPTVWAIHEVEEEKDLEVRNDEMARIRKDAQTEAALSASPSDAHPAHTKPTAESYPHQHEKKATSEFQTPPSEKQPADKASSSLPRHSDETALMKHDEHEPRKSDKTHPTAEPQLSEEASHQAGGNHIEHSHAHQIPTEGDVTAVILKTKAPIFALQLYKIINSEPLAQAAIPTREIKNLFDIVGNINWAFLFITALVIAVALIGVMVAIYNSLSERRRDIAIMRALGAHRARIFAMITLEAATVSLLGALVGIVLSKVLLLGLRPFVLARTGVEISAPIFNSGEIALILVVTGVGALVGILPAANAYRTDVAKNLNPIS
ncbi:MAG: ABC transporter permease [Chloroherpetonaceae bacterium]|nr:ABC transporter permease [Chloroherpetonaceae bacterium]